MTVGREIWRVRRVLDGLTFPQGRRGIRCGVVPSLEHQAFLRSLDVDVVVDIGANRGQFSLDVARALPRARVVAFEPLAREAAIWRQVFANRPSYVLREVALGASRGTRQLHLSASRDSSSLRVIGNRQAAIFPGTEEVGTVDVDVRVLDDFGDDLFVKRSGLLKLDVQGAELDVLLGAEAVLPTFDWVFAELSFVELYEGQHLASEVIEFLHLRGFDLAGVGRPSMHLGQSVQVDASFRRRR